VRRLKHAGLKESNNKETRFVVSVENGNTAGIQSLGRDMEKFPKNFHKMD
jgi:hypothetical protein